MRHAASLFLAAAMCLSVSEARSEKAAAARGEVHLPSNPVSLRGVLGDKQVQVKLRPKRDAADGIEGEYFVFGQSRTILLAGETDGTEISLEESENGVDVSGHWYGTLAGESITGEWQSATGGITKSFRL